jgi:hypothetical protein
LSEERALTWQQFCENRKIPMVLHARQNIGLTRIK